MRFHSCFFCHTLYLLADFLFAQDITSLSLPAFLAEILNGVLSFTGPGVAVGFGLAVAVGSGVTAGSSVIPGVGTGVTAGSSVGIADGVTVTAGPVGNADGVTTGITVCPAGGVSLSVTLATSGMAVVFLCISAYTLVLAATNDVSTIASNNENTTKKQINLLLDFSIYFLQIFKKGAMYCLLYKTSTIYT